MRGVLRPVFVQKLPSITQKNGWPGPITRQSATLSHSPGGIAAYVARVRMALPS